MKVMLVISHGDNTFDKTQLRGVKNSPLKKTNMVLEDFIKDSEIREFFSNL